MQDPGTLLGTWSVDLRAAPGAGDFAATFDEDSVSFSEGACRVGYWTATHPDGLLVMTEGISAGTGGDPCAALGRRAWMADVTETARFVVKDAEHVVLLDRAGDQVALLERRGLQRPAGTTEGVSVLPVGLAAPTPEQLLGGWYEPGLGVDGRSIWFDQDTWTYSQSVPCNSRSGPYSLSPAGGLVHLRDPNSRVRGCDARLPGWAAARVARVGLDGDVLVLLDAEGQELARLERDDRVEGSVLEEAQGEWVAVDLESPTGNPELWLRVDGEWLRHAFNASCNTADDELRLSGDGWVIGSRKAQAGGCEPGGQELLPGIVARVVVDGDRLSVLDLAGAEIRRFERVDP